MDTRYIIKEALTEYDSAQPVIRYLQKNTKYKGEQTKSDSKKTVFTFVDKETNDLVLETEIEVLAVYYDKLNVWSWAWSQIGLMNSENYLAKQILQWALNLESGLSYIKSLLTTSRGVMKDLIQIDINLAISSRVIKKPYIFSHAHFVGDGEITYYLILLNIPELDKLKQKIGGNRDDIFELE